ncbi:hypothetical protein [Actinoallomurus sp. CA-150999]|uniref:hypothetical protein n=1 Tax=Actinoallomurus sp. CA-150999 TaxID=3239887 RepID=UPI003D8ED065
MPTLPGPFPSAKPLVLTGSITRMDVLRLFRQLAADPDAEARFLDDPAATLAQEAGWNPTRQRSSSANALLVGALRSPRLRALLRDPRLASADAMDDAGRATISHASASVSSSVSFSSHTSTSSSASVSTSTTFTTGGVGCDSEPAIDPAGLRFGIRGFLARVRGRCG